MRLAAIDLGSNACRLLINDVTETANGQPLFTKLSLVRVPLRLGFDVFDKGIISDGKKAQLIKTMHAYRLLLDVYEVHDYIACATSAMRDAGNAKEILEEVKKQTGIDMRVITGEEEASFIYENHVAENLTTEESYLYIDVGGGSTELTFFTDGKLVFKESFDIGTIRMLKNQVTEKEWVNMKEFIRQKTNGYHHVTCIGSGGNINKIFSLSRKKEGKPLHIDMLKSYYREMSSTNLIERMRLYQLREDRADVIVPALLIYTNVMTWADAQEIFVPKIGLADGLIHHLYDSLPKA